MGSKNKSNVVSDAATTLVTDGDDDRLFHWIYTNNTDFYKAVLADLHLEHKKAGLSHLEKLVAVAFLTEPWTPENGCLTAANKLQRREVIRKFEKEFNAVKKKGIF